MACRRGGGDALLDKLALKWSVNLLRIPRGGIGVADVFVIQKRNLDQWDRLASLYQPKLELPEPDSQHVGDMDEVESLSYDADTGFEALQGFLTALGVPPLPLRATIKAARQSTVTLSFSVEQVTRNALLPGEIKREMDRRARGARWGSVNPGRRYVVAHAVWEAKSLHIRLGGTTKTVGELSASLAKVASGSAGLRVTDDQAGSITYRRQRPVVFGVQVTGIRFEDGVPSLEDAPDLQPRAVRGEEDEPASETPDGAQSGLLIGDPHGSPFVSLGPGEDDEQPGSEAGEDPA